MKPKIREMIDDIAKAIVADFHPIPPGHVIISRKYLESLLRDMYTCGYELGEAHGRANAKRPVDTSPGASRDFPPGVDPLVPGVTKISDEEEREAHGA